MIDVFEYYPIESAPNDRRVVVYLPWLDLPNDKRMKNTSGWYIGMKERPRGKEPYRWRIFFSGNWTFIGKLPAFWAALDESRDGYTLADGKLTNFATHH